MRQLPRCRSGTIVQVVVLCSILLMLDHGLTLYRKDEVMNLRQETQALHHEAKQAEDARDASDLDTARMLRHLRDLKARIESDEAELAVSIGVVEGKSCLYRKLRRGKSQNYQPSIKSIATSDASHGSPTVLPCPLYFPYLSSSFLTILRNHISACASCL